MPISVEEKRELNKAGFRVVDIRFKPEEPKEEAPKAKPKTRAKKA
jgi:hypothetical protein